jgi:hypothetical protein
MNIVLIKNSNFKYTSNKNRKKFVTHLFPYGNYIIDLIQSIPWKSYKYNGKMNLWYEDADGTYKADEKYIYASTEDFLAYYYFGGCVYEILDALYNANLHKYTDPTGDIDVRINMPKINYKSDKDYTEYYFKNITQNSLEMSDLLDNYTRWIYDEFKKQLETIPTVYFQEIFNDTIPFDYKTNYEGKSADITTQLGNLWLVRTLLFDRGMIKIQLIAKFKDMLESDHIVEFVLPVSNNITEVYELISDSVGMFTKQYQLIKKYPVETFSKLYSGNFSAIKERYNTHNKPNRHKFYNHIGRLIFLNTLLPSIIQRPDMPVNAKKIKLTLEEYATLTSYFIDLFILILNAKENKTLINYCLPHMLDCTEKQIIKELTGNIIPMIFKEKEVKGSKVPYYTARQRFPVGKQQFTVEQIVQELNKISGGYRRKIRRTRSHKIRTIRKTRKTYKK